LNISLPLEELNWISPQNDNKQEGELTIDMQVEWLRIDSHLDKIGPDGIGWLDVICLL